MEIAIIIIAVVGITVYLNKKKEVTKDAKKQDDADIRIKNIEPEELLSAMGVELKLKSDEDEYGHTHYFVAFQGGNFHFSFTKGSNWVNIHYSRFYACKLEHLNNALFVANQMNMKYSGWGCYINMAEVEKDENPVSATLSYAFMMDKSLEANVENLKRLMELAFCIAREFGAELDEKIKKKEDIDNLVLTDKDFRNRIAHIQWLESMDRREELGEEYPDYPSVLSVSALVNLFDNADFGCLQDLRIVCGQELQTITDIAEIEAFNIREYIRQRPDATSIKNISFTFGFEFQELFVNLTKTKASTENTLIYAVNIVHSGSELDTQMDNRIPFSSRTMMEVRLTDAEKDYWEAKYMIDEAMDKFNDERYDELTDEERMIVSHTNPSVQADIYWGKKYYNKNCHLQALYHFNRVFSLLKEQPDIWDENMKELYLEVSFYIGFIYDDLGMHDRAFFYLYKIQNEHIGGMMEFVNCLCNMRDVDAKDYILSQMEKTRKLMNKSEENMERLMPTYHFLYRRYAFTLIDRGELDDAERMLNDMIAEGQDVEFARKELDYIKKIRDEEANREKEEN